MMDEDRFCAESINYNKDSLQELAFAIESSQGQFSLILAKCSYSALRECMVQRLREICPEIREIHLEPSVTKLYSKIREFQGDEQLPGLIICGLESVKDIEQLLLSLNPVREEFRKNCRFAVVLWVNDDIVRRFRRLIPDFESWTTRTVFAIATDELVKLLQQGTDAIFERALSRDISSFFISTDTSAINYREIEAAIQDLRSRGQELESALKASLEFALGQEAYLQNDFETALERYQQSLDFWQSHFHSFQLRAGVLLFHIGLCYLKQVEQSSAENSIRGQSLASLQDARKYFQQCLDTFEAANRPDLVLKFIKPLGDLLQRLKAWDDLQQLAQKALTIDTQDTQNKQYLAPLYGFMATVALQQYRWQDAQEAAQTALDTITQTKTITQTEVKQPQPQGRYLFLLAEAECHLGQSQTAIEHLERARNIGVEDDPQLYIQILKRLRQLYFEQKQYLDAYLIKKEGQTIAQRYGFRAFIGTSRIEAKPPAKLGGEPSDSQDGVPLEIIASGRKLDVERLVKRILRPDYKVIVIYGDSGVGKSSLVNAGLVPTLQGIAKQEMLPVSMRVYTDWVRELGERLREALEKKDICLTEPLNTAAAILEQLQQQSEAQNLRVVLIFDQFEEFFFVKTTEALQNQFFAFLVDCLKILPLKVILSLRKDYLHHLLDIPGMESINDDILSKKVLYQIGNFLPEDTKVIIRRLTEQSKFHLQDQLIEKLVEDLTDDDKVRPIELQVVGAQLQEENIKTLAEYQQFGTKEELVKRYLNSVVEDCGEENQQAAYLVLYLLTDEKGTRPLKTRAELETDLEVLGLDLTLGESQLDLVLEILVASGLVFVVPESPDERYQLVHDYLVSFIREQQPQKIKELIAELEKEREQRRELEKSIQEVRQELTEVQAERDRINREVQEAKTQLIKAQADLESAKKITLLEQEGNRIIRDFKFQQLDSLVAGIKAGKELKHIAGKRLPQDYPIFSPISALQQIFDDIKERNRLQGHQGPVLSVSFSPDGKTIASASGDGTVRLWDRQGKPIGEPLKGHQGRVWSVSFSPDGKTIASASGDRTVRLWDRQGKPIGEPLKGHQDTVRSVSFSPDGKTIASASDDRTVRLWDRQGKPIGEPFKGHQSSVRSVSFSPDGKTIASASGDGTVRLWDRQGKPIGEPLKGHQGRVRSVSFSPDGQTIASASDDGTVRLWNLEGLLDELLVKGCDWVRDYLATNPNLSESERRLCEGIGKQSSVNSQQSTVTSEQ